MALIINIDSSLETATVSIAKDGIILKHLVNDVQKQHASFLHQAVQTLTNELQIAFTDIAAIGCTVGPGSYTGLRVGLAAAKGFCYALDIPLITIGTLEAMAHTVQIKNAGKEIYYCPMIDARRMEAYTAYYDQHLNELISPKPIVINKQFFQKELETKTILFFGNGMEKFKDISENTNAQFIKIGDIYNSINLLSYYKFSKKIFAPLAATAPLYAKEFYNG